MEFLQVLTATVLSFILREAPNVARNEELKQDFENDISVTLALHAQTSSGLLYNSRTDVLILSAITYRESRFRSPTVDGDCRMEHPLIRVPSGSWPKGYVPVMKQVCRAVGPQQLNKSGVQHLPPWKEIQELFPERGWETAEGRKKNKLTEKELREPSINIRLSYGILAHWKNECRHKDGSEAPVGVWFTAYRMGRCPFLVRTGKYHIDDEAKTRCGLIDQMVDGFKDKELPGGAYALPQEFRCVYSTKKAAS